MKVFTKLGLVFLAFVISAGVLVAQTTTHRDLAPKSDKPVSFAPASDDLFDLQFDFVPAGVAEAGIETDGEFIYTSVWSGTGEFLKYDSDGTYLYEFTISEAAGCRDMAYNGTYFYGGAAGTTIFEMDFGDESLVSSFTGPVACRAIAYNDDDDTFYCNNWSSDITEFDMTGANLSSFVVGPVGASYYGLAYQGSALCGDGPFLWGYAQIDVSLNWLVQMELPSGVETGVTYDLGTALTITTAIAGGLAIEEDLVAGTYTILGNAQGEYLWGLELCESSFVPLDNDLGVQSILAPNSGLGLGSDEAVTIVVKNYGDLTQTDFDVWFTLDGGSPITETVSTTLNAGETYEHTFGTTVDLSGVGMTYTVASCVDLVGDENADNNCKSKTVENIEPTLCLDGLYTTGCDFGDGLVYWDLADVNALTIGCDGPTYLWYHDYTDMVHNVEAGMDYTLTVQAGYTGTWVDLWVDWNGDLYMSDDELLVNDWELADAGVDYTTTISIPADAPTGEFLMRYRTNWLSGIVESCETVSYGNCCDFGISTGGSSGGMATVYPMSMDYWTGSTDGVDKTETSMINALGDAEKGWIKWDVSSIPASDATIDSIRVWVYVSDANWPYWRITPLASDPETADAGTIFDEVVAGQDDAVAYSINNEGSDFGMGWHSYLLMGTANADLEAALAGGWWATGIGDTDAGTTYYLIVDGWNETNMPYAEVYYGGGTGGNLEPPTNLEATVVLQDVGLTWDEPAGSGSDLEEIAYDDGTSEGGWWISNPSTAADYMAVRMTMPEDGTLQEIGLFTYTTDGDFNDIIVCADDGTGLPDLAAAYENFGATVVPYATGDWLFLTMSNPTAMTSGEDFWVVANWPEGNLNGPFIGGDNTVAPLEDRNYWNNAGTWNLWTADNFMMRAYYSTGDESYTGGGIQVIPSTNARELTIPTSTLTNPVAMEMTESWKAPVVITGMDELIGYNVYRDAELIGIVTSEAYVDLGLAPGMYDYYVTALYDEGESDPSNTVNVTIDEIVVTECEDFDDLTVGGYVAEQLGGFWSTWGAAPGTAEDATVSDAQSISPSNSMYVDGTNDMVHFFDTENLTSGVYEYSINIYVPTGYTGYFNLQKDITIGVEWGFQVMFEDDGLQYIDGAAAAAVLWPFDYDTWINCVMVVDLDMDWMMYYVDGELVHEYQWTLGTFGTPGAQTLASANFYANPGAAGTPPGAYYDDICFNEVIIEPCENFDALTVGGYVAEQLGDPWDTWSGTPGSAEDAIVDDTYSSSAPNAFRVDPNVDLIYKFGANPIASGAWLYSNMMYVASGTTGYFNVQSEPTPGVAWVIEITFNDGGTGTFVVDGTTTDFSYTQDAWFWAAVNIDVDNGMGDVWFGDEIVHSFETANTIGGIDFFGAAATDAAYYDDVCFEPGYEIMPPAPPTDLVLTVDNGDIVLNWMAPSGEKSAVITNGVINPAAASAVEKSAFIKNDPAPASDAQFDLLFNFAPAGTAEAGIETDGMYIYTSVWSGTGNFLKYDQDGTFMEEFTIAGADGCRDMAYNGTYFYGGAASTTIFEMDFDFQVMVSTFTGPAACRAVAYNEVDDAFYCNNWSDDIVMFDMSGANLGSFPVGPVGASYYGLAFDNYSGGMYLWGYAQAGANTNELVQIELPSGTETGLYFDVGSVIDPAGSGIAGGLAIDNMFVPDVYSFVGNMQGIALWGLELTASTSLQGYNVYYSLDGGAFDFVDFVTETTFTHVDPGYGEHCYYVTAVYDGGESEPSNTACEELVGIQDNLANSTQVYPNPASSMVNIKAESMIQNVVIYNFAGQVVANENVGNLSHSVNVSQFNPGVYIFQIETTDGRLTKRVVIE